MRIKLRQCLAPVSVAVLTAAVGAGLAGAQTSNVIGWGNNQHGQLDIPTGLIASKIVRTWGPRSMVIKPDGTLVAWGPNTDGAGDVPPGLTGVVAAAGGPTHTLALKSDGTVVAWGNNDHGQIDVPPGLDNVIDVAAGYYHSVALRNDGTVVAWGLNANYLRPLNVSGVIAITAGTSDTMALKSDGTIYYWGSNPYPTPVPEGLSGVVAVSKGWEHALALKSDGTVVGWGNNAYGQLDIPPGLTDVVSVTAGLEYSLALKSNGTVVTWGRDAVPPPSDLGPVQAAMALGGYHYLALRPAPGDALREGVGDPIPHVLVGLGKKPNPRSHMIVQETDANGVARFTLDAGTYQLTVRQPPSGGSRIEGLVRAMGTTTRRAIKTAGIQNAASVKPIATGRMVLNPDSERSQVLALGLGSRAKDIILDEEITLSAPATLDLQLTMAGDPVPATGLTFVAAQGSLKTMPQSIPIEPPAGTQPRTVTVRKLPAAADFIEVLNPLTVLQPGQPMPPIQIAASTRGFKAGLYSAPLEIAITGDVNVTRTLTVHLHVVAARKELPVAVGARSLIFTAPVGGSAAAQSLRLWNANGAEGTSAAFAVGFVNPSDAQYLSIAPNQRTILSGGSADVSVQPLPAALSTPGPRTVTLAVSSRDAVTQTVEVKIIAVPANCRATQLFPVVLEAPGALVGGLQSSMSVAVVDDCGTSRTTRTSWDEWIRWRWLVRLPAPSRASSRLWG